MGQSWICEPGERVDLDSIATDDTCGLADKKAAEEELRRNVLRIAELQGLLWAENRRAVLIVLQGMDTSGKDGLIRSVLSGVNPQGVRVHAFGPPSAEESDRDFLWRVHRVVPARGEIGVFNRSHYEDVLVARVAELVPRKVVEERYAIINQFERLLSPVSGGYVTLLKFFLHISRDEQEKRLRARLLDPTKSWKMQPGDLDVREQWDEYMHAYELVLQRCSTDCAPWSVIPADRKWVRNALVSRAVARALEELDLRLPEPRANVRDLLKRLK